MIITGVLFLSSFGIFVNTAYAGIADDLVSMLNLPATPSGVPEYPPGLTDAQINTLLGKIKEDPRVQSALSAIPTAQSEVDTAQNAVNQNFINCNSATSAINGPCPEQVAFDEAKLSLEKALADLEKALISARNNQESLIKSYLAENDVNNVVEGGIKRITDRSERAIVEQTEQALRDQAGSAPVPISQSDIDAAAQARQNASAWNTPDGDALEARMAEACVIFDFGRATNIMPCVAEVVYKVIYRPTAYLLMGSGIIFDEILSLSIEGDMVAPPFIDTTWTVVRDFSNMIFIFILLYTGVMTILGEKNWQKTVLQVVFIALLINFSLFFTKVVIDAGNVLAVGVKSAINPGHSLSEGLAAAFQPQQFLKTAGKEDAGNVIIVFLVAAVISVFAAYVFFKAALLFMGRLLAFWFLMIISPFAFISTTFPSGNQFNKWIGTLVGQAFVAPVFLFFIYIIMKVISEGNGILGGFTLGTGWFESLLGPVIVATLLIMALSQALEFAEGMAGSLGKTVAGLTGKVLGTAAGVATGGVALAGRSTIGKIAANKLASGNLKEGTLGHKMATMATQASFDVRSLAGEKSILGKKVGGLISKGGGALGVDVGKAGGVGGVEKQEKTRVDKILESAKEKEMNVFEQQGAHSREAAQKEAVVKAEEAHAKSAKGQEVATATAFTERAKADKDTADKKLDEAQKAHDAMRNSGLQDSKISQTLANAKKEAEEARANFDKADWNLIKAKASPDSSGTEKKLKEAQEKVTSATKVISTTNEARRAKYAEEVAKGGRHATAEKVRKGEETGHAKKLKDLNAEKKKAQEDDASEEIINYIDDRIEKHKGNK